MQEGTQREKTPPFDPCLSSNRPASGKTQDISHVLASTLKDLYANNISGKDTFSEVVKTKKEHISCHDRYKKELQQAHYEFTQRIKEADMLESHIIQANARAAASESQACERMKEANGNFDEHQSLLMVESAFPWCVDSNLLEINNLISPRDYLTKEKTHFKTPSAIKSDPARATIAHTMHVSRGPQDDGYSLIPSPEKALKEMNDSDISLTFESSSDRAKWGKTSREKPNQTKPKPKWKGEPSASDREEGLGKLRKLKEQHCFLRNPRFLPPGAQQGGASLIRPRTKVRKKEHVWKKMEHSSTDDTSPVFLAKPSVVVFTDYTVGHVYETTLELKNVTSASRHIRLIPPTTSYFSIGLGRFPGEGGMVAPGMSCKYTVRFAPDSLGDYEDFIVVETQAEQLFVVPVGGIRPPPALTLPRALDCGYCLVGGVKFVEFFCQNVGFSSGTFCIIPKNQWPASNLRSVDRCFFSEQPPFAISPSIFVLQPGEATVVEVVFFPTTAEKSSQTFTIVCDNCQVKDISTEGEGQLIALELVSVSGQKEPPVLGEAHDLTAEHFVRFSPCNPHSVQEKKLIIRNNVHLELPYQWHIMKPNLRPLLPGETPEPSHIQFHPATDDVFQVNPTTGVLPPCQEVEFMLTFSPKELKDFHSVCHLVLRDVPEPPPEPSEDSVLQPLRTGFKVSDVIAMEIEVKGTTEPYQVLLDPYTVIIPGEVFICTATRRQFKMWNHSKTCIFFQWERLNSSSHIIEIEPPTGSIEENECFDFELTVTGWKPEKVVSTLVCHIEHCHKPVTLPVEVSFKGPIVILNVPGVDFGLIKLGEQTKTTLLLTNITQLEANWTLKEKLNTPRDTQIIVEPCSGVLPPLASCSVDVLFIPHFCQQFDSELELIVENRTGCHLSVRADVQSPQVCLLDCELLLSELYIGVPASSSVTLYNQTLLPTDFSWMAQLQGKQAELCTASFEPSSGTLNPNASMDITVTFTSHTNLELTEVAALCQVQGMNSPLVLGIVASKIKKLSVSYSLPSVGAPEDDETPSTPLLDFGDVVLRRPATRQLLITNQTAIAAPFTVKVEYFTCHALRPNNQSEKRFTYTRKPLHSVQAKQLEDKAHKEFVSSLLADGRGAAFFIEPHSGILEPYASRTVDITAYTDMWGEYRDHLVCEVGDLEATLLPMQMTVKGCPLYFQMTGPQPDNQTQGPTIHFGSHVSGGDTVSRSLRINNPSMFDICIDWEIDENDHNPMASRETSPVTDAEGNVMSSVGFRHNDGHTETAGEGSPEETSTPIQSSTVTVCNSTAQDEKELEYVCKNDKEEETSNLSDNPYCITPQQMVIPAKGSSTVHISFTPLTLSGSVCESKCVGLALGFLSLESEMAACVPGKVTRAQGSDLVPVRMELLGAVKPALLLVQMEEDGGVLEFRATAADLLKAGESKEELIVNEFDTAQNFQLKNNTDMPLHFKLGCQPPFLVLKPQPRAFTSTPSYPPTGDSQSLVLQPQHSMHVKVAFRCSLSLLDHADKEDEEVPLGVTLITSKTGQRKLRFQQNLLIHYSNNTLQAVPLRAHLDLASIRLSSDSIDFGFCYVGQTRTEGVYLYSHGAHTYWKSVLESDVFSVTPDFGLLKSKELHVSSCSQFLQISFTPSEDGEFSSTVLIQSPLVKTPLTLQLQGAGSFNEMHKTDQPLFHLLSWKQ